MRHEIPAGKNLPNDFNVIIEIPAHSGPTKYEMDKDYGMLVIDRFMATSMGYPCNYGYVPSTLADDGDPVDALVLTPFEVVPGCLIRCRPIALLNMMDEKGQDSKVLALPIEKVCIQYKHIQTINDLPEITLDGIVHFFESYKALEPNKWVKLKGWEGKESAIREIENGVKAYKEKCTEKCC
jgi:inorganic pyrophosphatase